MNFLEGGKSSVRNRRKILSRKGGQIKWEKLKLTVQPDNFMIMMQSFSVGFSLLSSLRCSNILKKLLRSFNMKRKICTKKFITVPVCVWERFEADAIVRSFLLSYFPLHRAICESSTQQKLPQSDFNQFCNYIHKAPTPTSGWDSQSKLLSFAQSNLSCLTKVLEWVKQIKDEILS